MECGRVGWSFEFEWEVRVGLEGLEGLEGSKHPKLSKLKLKKQNLLFAVVHCDRE